ncbi:MAG TPA: hypothetical protein VLJ88_05575 [Propionibacteriaceae bacterium]|nr:hypothetical protein [Propionibacteriaceae bacterium]
MLDEDSSGSGGDALVAYRSRVAARPATVLSANGQNQQTDFGHGWTPVIWAMKLRHRARFHFQSRSGYSPVRIGVHPWCCARFRPPVQELYLRSFGDPAELVGLETEDVPVRQPPGQSPDDRVENVALGVDGASLHQRE